jgi:hypothetical protein
MTRLPLRAAIIAVTLAVALAGCTDDPEAGPGPDEPTNSATSEVPVFPITSEQAAKIKGKMPLERVLKLLGDTPLLIQDPYGDFPGGCLYYAMEDLSYANVWQFCFNDEGISVVLTAFSPDQPAPPEDASPARAALIARADTVCQGQNGYLNTITRDVGDALTNFSGNANQKNLDAVVASIGRFIKNLEETHTQLAAFRAPDDKQDALTTYLDALAGQIDALTQAKDAIADRDLEGYDQYGTDFNDIGKQAITAAQDYGFTTCSAPFWG